MTTSSSSVPVLGPVLYFTSTDGYSYDVDNRPLAHLDTNIRHINTSLVGIGYGEHASLAGGQLQAGRAVSLASNGSVFYPTNSPNVLSPTENIVGLVIGTTDTGLNRVIWSSKHLDLDVLGLSSISAGGSSGYYLVTGSGSNGIISAKAVPVLSTDYIIGRIKSGPYIEVNTATELITNSIASTVGNTVKDNHANQYGFSRYRNLLLSIDAGQVPIQYTKNTYRQSYYTSQGGTSNPMAAALSTNKTSITALGADSTSYGTALDNLIVKERISSFVNNNGTDSVTCMGHRSLWVDTVYDITLPGNTSENYELQTWPEITSTNFSTPAGLTTFKNFIVDKYFQYERTNTNPKLLATASVFNPEGQVADLGGESARMIILTFFKYDGTTGLEYSRDRVILYGQAAVSAMLPENGIFPDKLITLT